MNTLIHIVKALALSILLIVAVAAGLVLALPAACLIACGVDINAKANAMSNIDTEEAA